jgi:hypothetical protein
MSWDFSVGPRSRRASEFNTLCHNHYKPSEKHLGSNKYTSHRPLCHTFSSWWKCLTSQLLGHLQKNPLKPSTHVPPLWHGLLAHSSVVSSERNWRTWRSSWFTCKQSHFNYANCNKQHTQKIILVMPHDNSLITSTYLPVQCRDSCP